MATDSGCSLIGFLVVLAVKILGRLTRQIQRTKKLQYSSTLTIDFMFRICIQQTQPINQSTICLTKIYANYTRNPLYTTVALRI